MSEVAKKIGYAMSLRTPQKEALSYLAAISENCDYRRDDKVTIEAVASEHCENQNQIKIADEFNFPSFCYHMLREYAVQIDTFGFWVDGVRLIKGVTLESLSDQVVQTQLKYISQHIPAYVLLKEGEKELAKRMCEWLDSRTNN